MVAVWYFSKHIWDSVGDSARVSIDIATLSLNKLDGVRSGSPSQIFQSMVLQILVGSENCVGVVIKSCIYARRTCIDDIRRVSW